jgi:multiple sugar transport system substrate-binding protein
MLSIGLQTHAAGSREVSGTAGTAPQKATLHFWCGTPEQDGPAQAIAGFRKANPDIEVIYTRYVNNAEGNVKLDVALASGQDCDVYYSYRPINLAPRAQRGFAMPLTQFLKTDTSFNLEQELGKGAFKWQDEYYGLPVAVWLTVYWLNMDMLEQAGLSVPVEWTWDEYARYAKALTKGEGRDKIYGAAGMHGLLGYWDVAARGLLGSNYLYKADGTSNLDHPVFFKALQTLLRNQNTEKTEYPYLDMKATKVTTPDLFMQQKVAMVQGAPHFMRYINNLKDYPHDFKVAVAPVPVFEKGQQNYNNGFFYLDYVSINPKTRYPEAAWKLLKWMARDGSAEMAAFGRIPANQGFSKEQVSAMLLGNSTNLYDLDSFKRVLLPYGVPGYNDSQFIAYNEINDIMVQEVEMALLGEKTAQAAVLDMKAKSDQAIQRAK